MGANILPFTMNLPPESEFVVADCCFAYDYFWGNSTQQILDTRSKVNDRVKERIGQVKKVSKELAKNKNIIIIPPILREELIGMAEYDILGKESYQTKKEMVNNTELIIKASKRANDIENVLKQNPLFLIDEDPIQHQISTIKKIQIEENLKYKDATYVYYAKETYDVNRIITVDKDFTRMQDTNFTVYIDNGGYDFYSQNVPLANSIADTLKEAMNK